MNYKIERNVPVPKSTAGARAKYPFREMKIGDSFFAPATQGMNRNRIASAATYFGIRHPGYRFSIRKVEGGWRVWRVAPKATA